MNRKFTIIFRIWLNRASISKRKHSLFFLHQDGTAIFYLMIIIGNKYHDIKLL